MLYLITSIGFFGIVTSMRPLVDQSYRSIYFIEFSHLAQNNLGLAISGMIFIASMAGIPPLSGFFCKILCPIGDHRFTKLFFRSFRFNFECFEYVLLSKDY
jgi:NADH:ubiquinone oxidoreductase subunit 2 (subunit N)